MKNYIQEKELEFLFYKDESHKKGMFTKSFFKFKEPISSE